MYFSQHVALAVFLRLCFVIFGEIQDTYALVKYTDVDYYVFNDAARYIYEGQSPYNRHTYRYTPLLAYLVYPNFYIHFAFGKVLFASLDVLTGILIYKILQSYNCSYKQCVNSALLWLYNPMAIVISTRGSSEPVMTSLMMMSILLLQHNHIEWLGLVYGLAVHFKMYPVIYALTFYIVLSDTAKTSGFWKKIYIALIPNKKKIKLVVFTILGFAVPTIASFYMYGMIYINESFLYHLTRKDTRHNFSPYFYLMYLLEFEQILSGFNLSLLQFAFQFALLLLTTMMYCTINTLPSSLFILTFIFVTFNKVCTSQYFLWYLCFIPLNWQFVGFPDRRIIGAVILWLLSQAIWLLTAYYVEFQGSSIFILLWISGLVMFASNVYIANCFCNICNQTMYKKGALKRT